MTDDLTGRIFLAARHSGTEIPLYYLHEFRHFYVEHVVESANILVKRGYSVTDEEAYLWMYLNTVMREVNAGRSRGLHYSPCLILACRYMIAAKKPGAKPEIIAAMASNDPHFKSLLAAALDDHQAQQSAERL